MRRGFQKSFRFARESIFGEIGMLKNGGKDGFQTLGQTGVPPVTYPHEAGMALAGLARTDFPQARAGRGAQKTFCFDRESIWVELACQKL